MDLRLKFNEDPEGYAKFRPAYAEELSEAVIRYAGLGASKAALEIGIGAGQATLPFLKTGCKLTAVEIGDRLAALVKAKFLGFHGFSVINQDFESAVFEEASFDLIYSASAFHWIPPEIGLPKVFRLLKRGGVFAWFSIHPYHAPECEACYEEMQKAYARHTGLAKPQLPYGDGDARKRADLVKAYGFADVHSKLYQTATEYDAKGYIGRLHTYSDHRALPDAQKASLFSEIEAAIDAHSGRFTILNTMDLCLAKKP
jgi:SAM-dependent methyltransferase